MIEAKLDPSLIEYTIYNIVKAVYTGKVTIGNRPSLSETELNDLIVVLTNGEIESIKATDRPIFGNCSVMIQIWVKGKKDGTKNAARLSELRTLIMGLFPTTINEYSISYKNEIGSRDSLGFHSINLNFKINF